MNIQTLTGSARANRTHSRVYSQPSLCHHTGQTTWIKWFDNHQDPDYDACEASSDPDEVELRGQLAQNLRFMPFCNSHVCLSSYSVALGQKEKRTNPL